ncbi:hypothetical protein [Aurantimicrobium sp. MWH-Uga1]|uniref:hypothetical protein n=1 Tax=Aurantimicrobium sp. MWH-Uga1 TaxID=2079575 RepID=UPI000DEE1208|nr:hypothetical protein [Aurantimicrobium sp. MWH-Uga1]AXE54973.1 hypothetical protein AURUGA1_01297 [Aurantimicrobium sp. MWH-Uga1]
MRLIIYPIWAFALFLGLMVMASAPAFATTASNSPSQIVGGPDNPSDIFEFDGALYFNAETTPGDMGIWKYDGNQFSVISQHIVMIPNSHVEFRGELYFAGYPFSGSSITDTKLYKATASGLSDPIAPMGFDEEALVVFNDVLYFTGEHPTYIVQTFDGTNVGTASGFPCCLQRGVVSGNKLYFSGWHPPGSFDLYSFDGTTVTQHSTVSQVPREIQVLNGSVYFVGVIDQSINWDKAWFTPTSTSVAAISLPFQPDTVPTVQFNNQIIISKPNTNELYGFNGTGVELFSQNYSGYGRMAASPSFVYFEGISTTSNSQLYYSDGVMEAVIPNTEYSNGIATMGTIGSLLYYFDNDNSQWWVFDPFKSTPQAQLAATGQQSVWLVMAMGFMTIGLAFVLMGRKPIRI